MNRELAEKLVARFPRLFRDYPWERGGGFAGEDGWYDLLLSLSGQLAEIEAKFNCELVITNIDVENSGALGVAVRPTEKVSNLCMDKIYTALENAADFSLKICQECGTEVRVKSYSDGYDGMMLLCEEHAPSLPVKTRRRKSG